MGAPDTLIAQAAHDEAFHEGERAMQTLAGVRERMAEVGSRVIRNYMPDQHRTFFTQLPFIVAGTVDAAGQPWASVLAAPPGFIESPDPQRLAIHARPLAHDVLADTLREGAPIGLLGIEPHTRRRNRMNGVVHDSGVDGFTVEVRQSFGNCPQYIQARRPTFVGEPLASPEPQLLSALDDAAIALIRAADTFYIATAHPEAAAGQGEERAHGVDVSHRGGRPGFVRVDGPTSFTAPDFLGNFFFNTLGNLTVEPRCGLLFIDFANGDVLQVAARAKVIWDGAELASFAGAERLLRFEVTGLRRLPAALPLRWGEAALSPVLARTGGWTP
jgi:predicted pyridoxine 5'-phosphate oxidase superfamily flavin-nucleotide-binding protein